MKKTAFLLLLILVSGFAADAQGTWVKQKLDEKITIKFPVAPTFTSVNNVSIYILKDKDSTGYVASVVDFKVLANLDSTVLAPLKDTQEFADQLKNGMSQTLKDYTLDDFTLGKWRGYTTYTSTGTNNTGKKNKLFMYMLLIGSKLYSLSCALPDIAAPKNKDLFLTSAEFTM